MTKGMGVSGRRVLAGAVCLTALGATLEARQTTAATQAASTRRYVDAERGLALEDLVAAALKQAPDLLAARARLGAAEAEITQANLRPNPGLSFEHRQEVSSRDRQSMVQFTWPFDLYRRDGRVAVAQQGVAVVTAAAKEQERQLGVDVRLQAGRLLAAARQLEIREAVTASTRQTRDLLAARVEAGGAPAIDRDVAHVEWQRAEAELGRQRAEVEAAAVQLKQLMGLDPSAPLLLRDGLEAIVSGPRALAPPGPMDAGAVARAADERPDVQRAGAEAALETARKDLAAREGRMDASLVVGYMNMNAGFPQLGLTSAGEPVPIMGTFHNAVGGVMFTLPWRNRNQGAVASAEAAALAARHERDARRLAAAAEIQVARLRDEQAQKSLAVFAGGLRELAAKNADVVRESHLLGRATLVDVLAENRRLLDVETAYTSALLEAFEARVALAGALGVVR
jgi:cobalt-zinc-cadmium efflux system outer membrane protein